MTIRCTLLADGPSDRVLESILRWAIREQGFESPELSFHEKGNLVERLREGYHLFPADLYVVHRDAEREPRQNRVREIQNAVSQVPEVAPSVPVVPIRMTEAWFLLDEQLLRQAANNPRGRVPLAMPALARLEDLPDPKATVFTLLTEATEERGRRRSKFSPREALRRLADLIEDYSPLRTLSAFQAFEEDLGRALDGLRR